MRLTPGEGPDGKRHPPAHHGAMIAVLGLLIALAAALPVPWPVAAQQASEPATLTSLLRQFRGMEGWAMEESLRVFPGERLYDLVDGGAMLYQEYSFRCAWAMRFVQAEKRISLEVYEMGDPAGAFGIVSYLAAGSATGAFAVGQEGKEGEGFVVFRKGRCAVTITVLQGDAGRALAGFARAVDSLLPGGGEGPFVATLLGHRPGVHDVVYFRGPLGYQKTSGLIAPDLLSLEEGALGSLEGCDAVLLSYKDSGSARRILHRVLDHFGAAEGGIQDRTPSGGLFVERGKSFALRTSGRYLIQVAGSRRQPVARVAGRLAEAVTE